MWPASALRRTGTRGSALVLEADRTGVYINRQPQVHMKLRVSVVGQPPYEVAKTEVVPLIQIGRLTSGMPLAVFVDPADREHVMIAWNEVPDPAAAGGPF